MSHTRMHTQADTQTGRHTSTHTDTHTDTHKPNTHTDTHRHSQTDKHTHSTDYTKTKPPDIAPHTLQRYWGRFRQPLSWLGIAVAGGIQEQQSGPTREPGAFVFVECHTSSHGKPRTGPARALKLWEGCMGIASVATSNVNSNWVIARYFLD